MNEFEIDFLLARLRDYRLEYEYTGSSSIRIKEIASIDKLDFGSLGFYRGTDAKYLADILRKDSIVLCKPTLKKYIPKEKLSYCVFLAEPDLGVCILGQFFLKHESPSIHPTAIISRTADVHESCIIRAGAVIGDDVQIGAMAVIEENSVIKNCIVGRNCHVFPGVVVGSTGLGSIKDKSGTWHHFPHFGRVIIHDNVTIQDNSSIARGSLGDTVIGAGVSIGPLTWVGHNTAISENVLIGQGVTIAGSVVLKENCIVWSNASIRDGVHIGANVVVGMGAIVVKNISDSMTVVGNPARAINNEKPD